MSRVLLDQNVPRALGAYLIGHEVWTAADEGWSALENGDLMRVANAAGFEVMVTCDQNIRYQQNMATRPIGLLVLSTNHWPTVRAGAGAIVEAMERLEARGYRYLDCGLPPRRRGQADLPP